MDCGFNWKRRRRLRQRPCRVDNRTVQDRSSFQEQSVSARGDQDDRRHRILGRWNGWIGSIPAVRTAPWTTSLPTSSKPSIILNYRFSRSEEHTSELQSLMRHSYAVFFLKQKTNTY